MQDSYDFDAVSAYFEKHDMPSDGVAEIVSSHVADAAMARISRNEFDPLADSEQVFFGTSLSPSLHAEIPDQLQIFPCPRS